MNRPHLALTVALASAALGALACKDEPTMVGVAGEPAVMEPMGGADQVGTPGAMLASPLAVRVVDAAGRPVPAVEVRWATNSGSIPAVDSTDDAGMSMVQWQLGTATGPATAVADVPGVGTMAFNATVRAMNGDFRFRYVEVGSYHACGILVTEKAVCWGYGGDGQLGHGAFTNSDAPVATGGDFTYRIMQSGRYHTCGATLAGQAYCWGNGADGRIGAGPLASSATPVPVMFNGPNGVVQVTVRAVATGLLHSCALSVSQQVWCWGFDGEGELGNGPAVPIPGAYADTAGFVDAGFRHVVAGGLHTCALRHDGTAACWGFNQNGQLGDGTTNMNGLPVAVAGGVTFRTDPSVVPRAPDPNFYVPAIGNLVAGYAHTCGIRNDGAALCWGSNQHGQLGTGNVVEQHTPALVAGGLSFTFLSAGYRHTCGLTTAGDAYCWGANEMGQLGDGTRDARLTPTPVTGGLKFMAISAGELTTCGVTTEGVAYCWGDNEYGQLGTRETPLALAPVRVATQP